MSVKTLIAISLLAAFPQLLPAQKCDRACLEGYINRYLDAMIARDPFSLPWSPKVKVVENQQTLRVGEGLWLTATARGTYKLYAADPGTGQVAFFGTMLENGTPIALALRLKIEAGRIGEAETLVVRDPAVAKTLDTLGKPDPVFLEAVPEAARPNRRSLFETTNKYFDAIEQSNGNLAPFSPDCNRVQNGVQTTNNPDLKIVPEISWNPMALGCRDQLNTRFFSFIRKIDPRRFVVGDEERGLVFGFFSFHIPGDAKSVEVPGHGAFPVPPPYLSPVNLAVAELYKIQDGKIRKVEALQVNVPYGTPDPFSPPNPQERRLLRVSDLVRVPSVDRRYLEDFTNRYLDAMVAHDASRVPVVNPIFTEDDVELRFGEGLWRTISGVGTYKLYFADPQAGQIGFFGTIRENGKPAALALRLKVDGGRLTEAESLVIRNERTAENIEKAGAPDPVLLEAVPVAERLPRGQLTAITNQYFEAIEQGNGAVAAFDADCNRFENGIKTSGAEGCEKQLNTGRFNYIRRIYPRRFPVVDEERQVVFGFFMFNHPGNILWVNTPGGGRYDMPPAAKRPFSVDVAELFRIKNSKIRKVEALMTTLPYATKSPFAPEE